MGKSAPQPPAPPDPKETAQAQASANADTARVQANLNRVDQYGPYGSSVYSRLPSDGPTLSLDEMQANAVRENAGDPTFDVNAWRDSAQKNIASGNVGNNDRWAVTQTLSPDEQAQLDASNQAIGTYGRAANSQLSAAEAALSQQFNPTLPGYADFGSPGISRDQVEAALTARIQPFQDRDRERLQTNLANQGLTFGSEAYRAAMDDLNRGVNDQRLAVTAAGGAEQSRLQQLVQGARQSSLAEQLALRNQPINEASALLSGSQINLPQFGAVPQVGVAGTNYLDAVGQQQAGQNAAYQGQVSTQNANAAGAAGLGAAALGAAASSGAIGSAISAAAVIA
jgi:hypothetical protein